MLLIRCLMTLGFTWYTFIILSPELRRTATFSGPHQANYWDFKGLHTLSWAEGDGFYHIQVENGFGLWQHIHQPDSSGAVWISGCGEFLTLCSGGGILPGQNSPQGWAASAFFLTLSPSTVEGLERHSLGMVWKLCSLKLSNLLCRLSKVGWF